MEQKLNQSIILITSSFPFGNNEVWAIDELNNLSHHGANLTIIPVRIKGKINNIEAEKFRKNVIQVPLINISTIYALLKKIIVEPIFIGASIHELSRQSDSFKHFFKNLIVLPKICFLLDLLKNKDIRHIHSYSTTTAAVVAGMLSQRMAVPWSFTLHSSSKLKLANKKSFFYQSQSATRIRTISKISQIEVNNFLGGDKESIIRAIHLGVKLNNNISSDYVKSSNIIIATPATYELHKGHIYAIEAAHLLVKSGYINFKWFFYGSGSLETRLIKFSNELGLE
jgi:hypothetical protein